MSAAPPVSRVVARGKIKVDARRALSKLRDHMLVDLHLYATEIARAAVALGATWLDLSWDADDVRLTFDGRPLEASAVARARDLVLAGEGGDHELDALRALGIGITAALGLQPAFVDVYRSDDDGCTRVRFEADYLAEEGAIPEPAPGERPEGLSGSGTQVHVRRAIGLETIGRAIRGDTPREIALLVDAARDAPLTLRVRGAPAGISPPPVVLRVDLDEPSVTRAVLEVLLPVPGIRATTVFLERGIRLVTYVGAPAWEIDDVELPLRVLVDAAKLPLNASRSDIRTDAEIVARVRAHIPRALEAAVDALRRTAIGETPADGVAIVDGRPEVHAEALGAIAASVAIAARGGRVLSAAARAVLDLPLMRDAVGAPMGLAPVASLAAGTRLEVYAGETAQAPELAPWLSGVPWLRRGAVDRAFAGLQLAPADERIAVARGAFLRKKRALAHSPSKPVLPASPSYVLKETFAVAEGPFAGLEGEIALVRREGPYRRAATVRVFVDERLLESLPLPAVPLSVDMAIAWPGRLVARAAYDGVLRDATFQHAVLYALRVAAIAIGERLQPRDPEIIQLAILAWLGTTVTIGDLEPSLAALGRLVHEAVWPISERGKRVTLAAIDAYARRTGAICTAAIGAGPAPDGRPVIDPRAAASLRALLPAKTTLVPYDKWLALPREAATQTLAREAAMMPAFLQVEKGDVEGFVGVGAPRMRIHHCGRLLLERARASAGLAVLEDRAAVPSPQRDVALYHTPGIHRGLGGFDLRHEDDALLELVLLRCERGELDPAAVQPYLESASEILAKRAKKGGSRKAREDAAAMSARIAGLPARAEERRRAVLKAQFLEQPPWQKPTDPARSATFSESGVGAATVLLPDAAQDTAWSAPPIAVLFDGRWMTVYDLGLPVLAWIDLACDDFVRDWTGVTTEAANWMRKAIGAACVQLVGDGARDGFAGDVGLLRLCAALRLTEGLSFTFVRDVLGRAKWPTVQGGERTIGFSAAVPFGEHAYSAYVSGRERSPYDEPAVHLPPTPIGELRRKVIMGMGCELRDVTKAIARLQERRSRGKQPPPPRLDGSPAHPLLRATLDSLGVTAAEGEIELAVSQEVLSIDAEGRASLTRLDLPFAVRAIFRCDDQATALPEIASAAERHVRSLASQMREPPSLPSFVRAAVRALVCADVDLRRRSADVDNARVFPDTHGAFVSLQEMLSGGRVSLTTDPSHCVPGAGPRAVFMTGMEKSALAGALAFDDVTDLIRAERLGAERRAAPPSARIELSEQKRAYCIFTVPLDHDGVTGEVGLLAPSYGTLRGIDVHATMRRLCTIRADDVDWPIVAAVNDDRVRATPAFDGLADATDVSRLSRVVRHAAASGGATNLAAPAGAEYVWRLFSRNVVYVFWVDPKWPEAPTVQIAIGGTDVLREPRVPAGLLPVRGRIWAYCAANELDAELDKVFRSMGESLGAAVARMKRGQLAEYQWDLRLLGILTDEDPKAELARDRPDEILLRIVALRAPHLIVPPAPPLVEAPPMDTPASSDSFLRGLTRSVALLVARPPPPPVDGDLDKAIRAMKLTGDPVLSVQAVSRGRPVRCDPSSRCLVVNTRHPAVRALEKHPARVFHLLTAAVSEINRELEPVTDAEELAILRDLLQE